MGQAYIIAATRTVNGLSHGIISSFNPSELLSFVFNSLILKTKCDPEFIERVLIGFVNHPNANIKKMTNDALAHSILSPQQLVNRLEYQHNTAQQTLHYAAQIVMSETHDIVIASGVENHLSRDQQMWMPNDAKKSRFFLKDTALNQNAHMLSVKQLSYAMELLKKYRLNRDLLDYYSFNSHFKALSAWQANKFEAEIIPMLHNFENSSASPMRIQDESIIEYISWSIFTKSPTILPDLPMTSKHISSNTYGASGLIIANDRGLKLLKTPPIARILYMNSLQSNHKDIDANIFFATQNALEKTGLTINQIDLYEMNEVFTPLPLAWLSVLGADPDRLNIHGGTLALGESCGSISTRMMTTLCHALITTQARYGMQIQYDKKDCIQITIIEKV
ncbi:MAG: hypothetical protein L0G61_05625 [Staphylococcus equorum]|nr:hypothetical protein [Acinetobacter sp.]MDN5696158.1 hypothetical protein [Staphylococcus equorum]